MGSGASALNSTLVNSIGTEFCRVKGSARRNELILEEVIRLTGFGGLSLESNHLALLYVMDGNKRGTISLQDLLAFTDFAHKQRAIFPSLDFRNRLEGLCTLTMWNDIILRGQDHLANWMVRLVSENGPMEYFHPHGTTGTSCYVHRDAILPFYAVIRSYLPTDLNFQQIFDLLQHTAEEQGLLDLEDERFDDFVPLSVVGTFCAGFVKGFMSMMQGVGFSESLWALN